MGHTDNITCRYKDYTNQHTYTYIYIYIVTHKNKYLTTDSRMLNVLEAFEFKGLDTFLKEEKKDLISDENILKLGLQ